MQEENNKPGINDQVFKVKFTESMFQVGGLLDSGRNIKFVVTKVYKFNLWRRILSKLGFSVRSFKGKNIRIN